MRQKVFTVTAAFSALLFIAVSALWLRSHTLRDYAWAWLPWPSDAAGPRRLKLDVDSGGGQVELAWRIWTAAERAQLIRQNQLAASNSYHRTFPDVPRRYARSTQPTAWNALGFKSYTGPTHTSLCFPYWSAALLTAPLPAAWAAIRTLRRRRRKAGRCLACGYDLRATPHRCPECGAAVPDQRTSATPQT